MFEIEPAIAAYLRTVQNNPVDRHSVVWAYHYDMWGDARGELGVPDFTDRSVLGVLIPYVIIPSMGSAVLVVDRSLPGQLDIVRLSAFNRMTGVDSWRCDYEVEDSGRWIVRPAKRHPMTPDIASSVEAARLARKRQLEWDEEWDFDSSLQVVKDYLEA